MKKFLIKSFSFAIVALLVLMAISSVLAMAMKDDKQEKMSWIAAKYNQNYGFAFLGSSRVLNMVDIKYLQDEWLTNGINLGTAGSGLADNYLTLYRFYENGNKINNLFLQLDEQSLDPDQGFGYPFHEYLYFDLLGDKNANAVYREQSGEFKTWLWERLPFTRYIEFNNPFKKALLHNFGEGINYDSTGGSQLLPAKSIDNWAVKDPAKQWSVDEQSKKYLDMIVELAQNNGTNVVFYTAPYPKDANDSPSLLDIEDFIIKTAAKKRIIFLDFRQTEISNTRENFRNLEHLNEEGVRIFMKEFSPEAKRTLR